MSEEVKPISIRGKIVRLHPKIVVIKTDEKEITFAIKPDVYLKILRNLDRWLRPTFQIDEKGYCINVER